MKDLEGFAGDAAFAELGKLDLRRVTRGTSDRSAGTGGQDVGGGHASQIVDQLVETRISDGDPVNIDYRNCKSRSAEQRAKCRCLDPRVNMGRGTWACAVGCTHRRTKHR